MEVKHRGELPVEHYRNLSLVDIVADRGDGRVVMEEWTDIEGYEGYYAVSTFGRVKSYSRLVYRERFDDYVKRKERILSQKVHRDGYLMVTLQIDKIKKYPQVHTIVANAFIENANNRPQVNHKFGDKKDNRVLMLEWNTAKENTDHALRFGLMKSPAGENSPTAKLTKGDVLRIRHLMANARYGEKKKLASEYGINVTAISKIVSRQTWKHI